MTGAAMAALLLAAAAAPAEAGFRYVPPGADRGAATEAVETGHADPAPGPGTSVGGTRVWRVHAGETLRQALLRWGERGGAEVTFLTDRRYRLDASAAFEGTFPDAVEALLRGLAHLPHPPAGAVSADGRSLAVTHRVPRAPEGESKP